MISVFPHLAPSPIFLKAARRSPKGGAYFTNPATGESKHFPGGRFIPKEFSELGKPDDGKVGGLDAIADADTEPPITLKPKPRLVGNMTRRLMRDRKIDFIGLQVSEPEEMAEICRTFRNPRHETFRVFFVKGNTIVGHSCVSTRLDSVTPASPERGWFKDQMQRCGADGYWISHNHPSGEPEPSKDDILQTRLHAAISEGFKGHIIINSGEFCHLRGDGNFDILPYKGDHYIEKDTPLIPHPALGKAPNAPSDWVKVIKEIQKPGHVSLVAKRNSNQIAGILEYPQNSKVGISQKVIRNFLQQTGARKVEAVAEGDEFPDELTALVEQGILADLINVDGKSYRRQVQKESDFDEFNREVSYRKPWQSPYSSLRTYSDRAEHGDRLNINGVEHEMFVSPEGTVKWLPSAFGDIPVEPIDREGLRSLPDQGYRPLPIRGESLIEKPMNQIAGLIKKWAEHRGVSLDGVRILRTPNGNHYAYYLPLGKSLLLKARKKAKPVDGQMGLFDMLAPEQVITLKPKLPPKPAKTSSGRKKKAPRGGGYFTNPTTGETKFFRGGAFIPKEFSESGESPVEQPNFLGGLGFLDDPITLPPAEPAAASIEEMLSDDELKTSSVEPTTLAELIDQLDLEPGKEQESKVFLERLTTSLLPKIIDYINSDEFDNAFANGLRSRHIPQEKREIIKQELIDSLNRFGVDLPLGKSLLLKARKKAKPVDGQMGLFDAPAPEQVITLKPKSPSKPAKTPSGRKKKAPRGGGYFTNPTTGETKFFRGGAFIPKEFSEPGESPVEQPNFLGGLGFLDDPITLPPAEPEEAIAPAPIKPRTRDIHERILDGEIITANDPDWEPRPGELVLYFGNGRPEPKRVVSAGKNNIRVEPANLTEEMIRDRDRLGSKTYTQVWERGYIAHRASRQAIEDRWNEGVEHRKQSAPALKQMISQPVRIERVEMYDRPEDNPKYHKDREKLKRQYEKMGRSPEEAASSADTMMAIYGHQYRFKPKSKIKPAPEKAIAPTPIEPEEVITLPPAAPTELRQDQKDKIDALPANELPAFIRAIDESDPDGVDPAKALLRQYASDRRKREMMNRDKPKLVANGINKKFQRERKISLIGQKIESPEDAAALAGIFRNPNHETFHYYFTKGDVVVGHTAVSSRLPGEAPISPYENDDLFFDWMTEQIESVGADGYWISHNHPSGNPSPSDPDKEITQFINRNIPGFKGHIVTNHKKYAVINPDKSLYIKQLQDNDEEYEPRIPHPALGAYAGKPEAVVEIAKEIRKDGHISILALDRNLQVKGILEVPDRPHQFNKKAAAAFMKQVGALRLVAVSDDNSIAREDYLELMENGVFVDVINKDGESYRLKNRNLRVPDDIDFRYLDYDSSGQVTIDERSQEGDRITTPEGHTLELRGGRWHRVDDEPGQAVTLPPAEPKPEYSKFKLYDAITRAIETGQELMLVTRTRAFPLTRDNFRMTDRGFEVRHGKNWRDIPEHSEGLQAIADRLGVPGALSWMRDTGDDDNTPTETDEEKSASLDTVSIGDYVRGRGIKRGANSWAEVDDFIDAEALDALPGDRKQYKGNSYIKIDRDHWMLEPSGKPQGRWDEGMGSDVITLPPAEPAASTEPIALPTFKFSPGLGHLEMLPGDAPGTPLVEPTTPAEAIDRLDLELGKEQEAKVFLKRLIIPKIIDGAINSDEFDNAFANGSRYIPQEKRETVKQQLIDSLNRLGVDIKEDPRVAKRRNREALLAQSRDLLRQATELNSDALAIQANDLKSLSRMDDIGSVKEGDRKTINGRTYELRGGRWHRVDDEPIGENDNGDSETIPSTSTSTPADGLGGSPVPLVPSGEPIGAGRDGGGDGTGGTTGRVQPRIVTARSELTRPADTSLVSDSVKPHLREHQLEGAALAIASMDTTGGFLLADGTGGGKTRQMLAIAQTALERGQKVLIVAPAEVIKPNWKKGTMTGSFAKDSAAMAVNVKLSKDPADLSTDHAMVTTYEGLGKLKGAIDSNTVVLFDEAHSMKNASSARTKHGMEVMRKAHSVCLATATPADKPEHLPYLFRTGVFQGRAATDIYTWLGLRSRQIRAGNKEITTWEMPRGEEAKAEVYRRLSSLFDDLTERGATVKREISMEGVEVDFSTITIPDEAHAMLQEIEDAYGGEEATGLLKAQILMHQRRQLEPYKIPAAVDEVKQAIAQGRQAIVFVSRVNYSEVKKKGGTFIDGTDISMEEDAIAQSDGTAKLIRQALESEGITDIAELHGGASTGAAEAMDKFQSGKAKVIIATVESGGTGVNLDDTTGDAPRTLIMMTPPFNAVQNVQAAGRVWRMTTRSHPQIKYLFTDTAVDSWNRKIIANKMGAVGAVVKGEIGLLDLPSDVSDEAIQAFLAERDAKRGQVDAGDRPKPKLTPAQPQPVESLPAQLPPGFRPNKYPGYSPDGTYVPAGEGAIRKEDGKWVTYTKEQAHSGVPIAEVKPEIKLSDRIKKARKIEIAIEHAADDEVQPKLWYGGSNVRVYLNKPGSRRENFGYLEISPSGEVQNKSSLGDDHPAIQAIASLHKQSDRDSSLSKAIFLPVRQRITHYLIGGIPFQWNGLKLRRVC